MGPSTVGDEARTAYARLDPSDPVTRSLVRNALDRATAGDPDLVVASLHWGRWETSPAVSSHSGWRNVRTASRSVDDRSISTSPRSVKMRFQSR